MHAVEIWSARQYFLHAEKISRAFFHLRAKNHTREFLYLKSLLLHADEKMHAKFFPRAENICVHFRFRPRAKISKIRFSKQFWNLCAEQKKMGKTHFLALKTYLSNINLSFLLTFTCPRSMLYGSKDAQWSLLLLQ